MFELLSETDQRRIGILNILFSQPNWITTREIAEQLDISVRTVQSDISYLKDEWGDQLGVEVSLKNGILIHFHSSAILHTVSMEIFKRGLTPRFLCVLFLYPGQSPEFYLSKLFVSKSTLVRLIPKINDTLSTLNLRIEKKENGYYICSLDELALRLQFASVYVETNCDLLRQHKVGFKYLFQNVPAPFDMMRFDKIICSVVQHFGNNALASVIVRDDIIITFMSAFYFISLIRENQGFHIASNRPLGDEISSDDVRFLQDYFPAVSREHLCPIHELLANVVLGADSLEESARLNRAVSAFYQRVFGELQISCASGTLQKLEEMLKLIYNFISIGSIKERSNFHRIVGFASAVRSGRPILFNLFQANLQIFSEEMQTNMDRALPYLIMNTCFYFPELVRASRLRRILVISDSGLTHAEFLANFIQGIFNGPHYKAIETAIVTYEEALDPAFSPNYQDYEIIITTNPNLPDNALQKDVIVFDDFPSAKNLQLLYSSIFRP